MSFVLGTRGSALATTQSKWVACRLESSQVSIEIAQIVTQGDVDRTPLAKLGGVGVFAGALRQALLNREIDLAVHSYKDLPTAQIAELQISCTPEREDPRDALVSWGNLKLSELAAGAKVGTGSPRRSAQLLRARPDLQVVDIRGNVPTRMNRALGDDRDLDAVILAVSGMKRLGLADSISEILDFAWAPAQGCLAVETRTDAPKDLLAACRNSHHATTEKIVTAEREILAGLQAGCAAPVGVTCSPSETPGVLAELTGYVFSLDGTQLVKASGEITESTDGAIGRQIAEQLLDLGAGQICDLQANKPARAQNSSS